MANRNINRPMSDTSIRVSHELADTLFDMKQKRGESYEDVIWRLINQDIDHEKLEGAFNDILMAVDSGDRDAAEDAINRIREAIDAD